VVVVVVLAVQALQDLPEVLVEVLQETLEAEELQHSLGLQQVVLEILVEELHLVQLTLGIQVTVVVVQVLLVWLEHLLVAVELEAQV
jgi:hypothetical protein